MTSGQLGLAADGTVLTPLDEGAAEKALQAARAAGFGSVAIAFMHGYRYTDHEARVAALAQAERELQQHVGVAFGSGQVQDGR